ncbi:hypothetical protein ZIOFF_048982 [Zingiber officinale]|uniref:Uncharacterized protein n=1 Tax=Zingiber officinale TaxID=94328 RepID=A0A8J5FS05_ZINOF|nr:hypothetical protein ZIOFF_048982 [Zingiber officinale]
MIPSKGSELPKPPLPIKQDAQFYSRLLSVKDTSLACPSFRVYYGVASGAVPFLWESQPGIPKHAGYSTNTFMQPPLSPPPSYFSSTNSLGSKKKRSKMFDFKRSFQKFCHPSPSLSSSSSSASLSSSGCRSRKPVVKCLTCFWSNAA